MVDVDRRLSGPAPIAVATLAVERVLWSAPGTPPLPRRIRAGWPYEVGGEHAHDTPLPGRLDGRATSAVAASLSCRRPDPVAARFLHRRPSERIRAVQRAAAG